uniref:Uncharacterized protein n=1 Tax=Panagrolaimus davidi TaxID=227884 RepID=A0A914QI95_9BILA
MEVSAIPDILQKTSESDVRISMIKFIAELPILGKMSESDKESIMNYGIRAFIAIIGSFCTQLNPAFINYPLLKIFPQTSLDLRTLSSFNFKDITEEELAVMAACSLSQHLTPNISDKSSVDIFFGQLSTCLHFKFNLRTSTNCTPLVIEFFNYLRQLYPNPSN